MQAVLTGWLSALAGCRAGCDAGGVSIGRVDHVGTTGTQNEAVPALVQRLLAEATALWYAVPAD